MTTERKQRNPKRDHHWWVHPRPKGAHPLRPGEKRKFTVGGFSGIVHEDTDADNNKLTYSKEGHQCTRCFIIEHIDIAPSPGSAGYGTIFDAMWQSGVPVRGDPHPYINRSTWESYFSVPLPEGLEFAADVIAVTPADSMNFRVTVEYAILNGATREASTYNDTEPGLLHMASSVQHVQTTVDRDGNPLLAHYGDGTPAYDIYDKLGKLVTSPTSVCKASKQVPSVILRFLRRQTAPINPAGWVCCVNSVAWTINYHEYDIHQLLCTRLENETEDGGYSYVTTYEFQARGDVPAFNTDNTIRGWEMGGFYEIQNGYAVATGTTTPQVYSQGQIPADAPSAIFQIYDEVDFRMLDLTATV